MRRALFLVGRDPDHPGFAGGDAQAWQWATHLAGAGWTVDYVALGGYGLPERAERDGVQVLRLGTGFRLAWRAFLHHRRSRPDLVYDDPIGGGRVPYLSPLYARGTPIAVWHQVTADLLRTMHRPARARLLIAVERLVALLYRRCLLWAPSAERADEITHHLRIPRERIAVVHPTLAQALRVADEPGEPETQVLCLGVLRPYKNMEHVVRAMRIVRRRVPDARLVIAGRGGDDVYEAMLRSEADGAVEFRLDVSDEERQTLMRDSAALVLPSLLEGFGIVSIEANAEGTPVVASSGVPLAAVAHGDNGLRYEHGDVEALAGHLESVLTDADLRRRLAQGALRHARGLTVHAMAPRFDALVRRALAESERIPA